MHQPIFFWYIQNGCTVFEMRYYKDDSLLLDILLHLLLYGNHFSIQPSIYFKHQIQINIIALSFIRYIHHTYCIHLNMKLHVNVKCIYKNCVDSWFSCWVFIFRRTLLQTFASCHKFISCENWALRIVNFVNPAEMLKTLSGNFRIWDMDSSYFCTQFWYSIQQNFYNVI